MLADSGEGQDVVKAAGESAKPGRDDPSGANTGLKLRQLRRLKRLRLKELATAVDLSESMLSKIENNRVKPAHHTLAKLADALGTELNYLTTHDDIIEGPVNRRGTRPIINSASYGRGTGIRMERLIPYSGAHLLQANIHIIAPGGRTQGSIVHEGEEIGLVLEGTLDLTIGKRTYSLSKGDSFHFASHLPHSYRNRGTRTVRVMWVNTPPSYYIKPQTKGRR
jgi:transcriptional regulator with XRE-family HTH domain